jgi:hypothetical protein
MTTETVKLTNLTPHPDNPRQGDIGAIVTSIKKNGWYGSIVAQTSTGLILAGNHRYQAAKQLGMTEIPVFWVDVDETVARRILLADNRANDLASYNDDILATLLADLASTNDLLGTGWDGDDLDRLLGDLAVGDMDLGDLGNVRDGMSAVERTAEWQEAGIRSIILPFPVDEYEAASEAFKAKRLELGVESNSEVVVALLEL